MKRIIAALAITLSLSANARTNETCLNMVMATNGGVLAPYSQRQCFGIKHADQDVSGILSSSGYTMVASGNSVSMWQGDVAWIVVYLDQHKKVSEILFLNNGPL